MKKCVSLILIVSLMIAVFCSAYALDNTTILSSTNYTIDEKLEYLEEKWNVELELNDGTKIPENSDLIELDAFLGKLTNLDNSILSNKLFRDVIATRADGTFNYSWDTDVNEHVTEEPYGFYARGTIRTTWRVTKRTENNKVYLSGTVTGCRFLSGSTYSGSATFTGGSLNISDNGTACATTRPSADMSFEIIYDLLSIVFTHTFDTEYVQFFLPN